jgi:uncharacterized repeat protein (TIGR01451 family)
MRTGKGIVVALVLVAVMVNTGMAADIDCEQWIDSVKAEPMDVARACGGSDYVPVFNAKATARGVGDPAYAQDIGYVSDNFITFPLADMTGNTILGTSTNTYYGMDFDTAAMTLYATNLTLGTIDLATGAYTSLVTISGLSSTLTGLSIDPTDETFYISTATDLYTLDPVTGATTLIGPFGTTGGVVIDLALSSSGAMYLHDIGDDSIYSVDKATGVATLIGSTGFDASYAQGMDFDYSDDTLYAWIYTGGGTGNFCSIDLATGAATALSWIDGEWEGAIQVAAGPPRIAYVGHGGIDSCATDPANENGIWEPGETIQIPVDIMGGGDFTGVTGTLSSSTAGVTIVDGNATWADLVTGVVTTSDAPHFSVLLGETVPCLEMVNFDLTLNAAEGGPWSYSFSHVVGQALAPDVPIDIPDNDPASPGVSLLVVGDDVTITDLNVHVQISHTWVGDIQIVLRSPAGNTAVLLDRPGVPAGAVGCMDNNMDITFDDAAAMTAAVLEDHCAGTDPWYSGEAQPVDPLSVFNGESTAGTWQLEVTDNAAGDLGTIVDWELLTTPAVGGVCNVCVGASLTADLGLTKGATNNGDGTATYTLVASNSGPDDAIGVVVLDTLPGGVTYLSDDCGGAFVDPQLTWTIGSLLNGASATCHILVQVDDINDSMNTASISGAVTDPNPGNDVGSAGIEQLAEAIPVIGFRGMVLMVLLLGVAGFCVLRRAV